MPYSKRIWLNNYDESVPAELVLKPRPLYSLLDNAAEKYPRRLAVIFENKSYTYAQLQEQVEILATGLTKLDIGPRDRVGIMLPNLPQTILAFWAILKLAGIVIMINPLYRETELVNILNDADISHLITLDVLWQHLAPLRNKVPVKHYILSSMADALAAPLSWFYNFKVHKHNKAIDKEIDTINAEKKAVRLCRWSTLFEHERMLNPPLSDPANDPALIQYTGGTTGTPKGAVLTHANLMANCRQVKAMLSVDDLHHRFLALIPFFHIYGLVSGITIPTCIAALSLPIPRYTPSDILALIDKYKLNVIPGTPPLFKSLLQENNKNKYKLNSIQLCISGSVPMSKEIYHELKEATATKILEGYGLTEASPITHTNPMQHYIEGSIGLPLPNTDAKIVDAVTGKQELAIGEVGELVIKGPQVMQGYWRREQETKQILRDGWLYTGDLAYMDEQGYFYIQDRKKDLVVIDGYNVYPQEIEEVISRHPAIADVACIGIADEDHGNALKIFIVLKKEQSLTVSEFISWCKPLLANYKVPREIEFRESLPKSFTGKLLRHTLKEQEKAKKNKIDKQDQES